MTDRHDPAHRKQEVRSAVLKFLGITAVVGVLIWIGTTVVVNSLGLDEVTTGPIGGSEPFAQRSQLPTVALPSASPSATPTPTPTIEPEPTEYPSETVDPNRPGENGLTLSISPAFVKAEQRIDLTGEWPGKDNVSLHVQRFEDGEWSDFGVHAQVSIGSFATYVLTSREGENKFRVYDPVTDTASNAVTVTVG